MEKVLSSTEKVKEVGEVNYYYYYYQYNYFSFPPC